MSAPGRTKSAEQFDAEIIREVDRRVALLFSVASLPDVAAVLADVRRVSAEMRLLHERISELDRIATRLHLLSLRAAGAGPGGGGSP